MRSKEKRELDGEWTHNARSSLGTRHKRIEDVCSKVVASYPASWCHSRKSRRVANASLNGFTSGGQLLSRRWFVMKKKFLVQKRLLVWIARLRKIDAGLPRPQPLRRMKLITKGRKFRDAAIHKSRCQKKLTLL